MQQAKLRVGSIRIWVDESDNPCCDSGALDDVLPQIRQALGRIEAWIERVDEHQKRLQDQRLTRKEEKSIERLMKLLNCDRDKAIRIMREDFDL